MVEEEKKTEAANRSANGNYQPEDVAEAVTEAEEEAKDELKAKEEDVKTEVDKNKDSEKEEDGQAKDNIKEEEEIKNNEEIKNKDEEEEIKNSKEVEIKNDDEGSENEKGEAKIEVIKLEKENNAEEDKKNKIAEENIEESEEKEVAEKKVEQKKPRMRGKGLISRVKGTAKKEVGEKKANEPRIPTSYSIDRPVRERKTVERLVAIIEKEPAKEFLIGKGRGTALKDIPNVAFKLSRKKTDETFKALHVILFGRRGKAFNVKYNISQFSGFVWHENEEKQRSRIKEKFDKCVKEKLLEFCDVLDVPVAKTTTKKEDIVTKLLDFLAAPYATTDMLLSEKDKSGTSRKRQRELKSSSISDAPTAKRSARKRRKTEDSEKVMEEKNASESEGKSEKGEDEERENGASDASEDEVAEHSEKEEKVDDSKEESEEEAEQELKSSSKKESSGKRKSKEVPKSNKAIPAKSLKKSPAKSLSKQSKVDDKNDVNPTISTKKRSRETATKKSSTQKSMSKEKSVKEKSGKKTVTEQKNKRKKVASVPTEKELREATCEILKEVDFNKATFTDIVKQLAQKFDADLTPKRSEIKLMIQEELTKIAEEDDKDEDEEEGETEKAENPGKPVKA